MGSLVEVFPAMKGTILIALALLVASCQMKPAKHFLIETKTKTEHKNVADDEPARKGDDYINIGSIGNHWGNNNEIKGDNFGSQDGNHGFQRNQHQVSQRGGWVWPRGRQGTGTININSINV